MNTSLISDLSDATPICQALKLYLKPIAKLNICVALPKLKAPGQTISNWEVMEKIKFMCSPHQFTLLRVTKSTLDFVRFEGETENKNLLSNFITLLDGKHIKLSGFPVLLKISCGESKHSFPTRHDWDSFFRDSKDFDETQPGERPDTVHLTNIPCKFFTDKKTQAVSEELIKITFLSFGEIRNIDVPMLDPYRSDTLAAGVSNFQTFSYGSRLNFEMYVQFKEYIGFAKCMNALKGMKLVAKESDGKAVAATIKVTFDCTKHLSAQSIAHRLQEKRKIEKLQREREEEKRKERELIQKKADEEKQRELDLLKEQEERRRKREEKRRRKKKEKKEQEEAARLALRIAMEERKLLLAQRKLESIRLLSELLDRVKADAQQAEVEKLEREIARKAEEERRKKMEEERKRMEKEEKKREKLRRKELEMKSRLLKRKLEEDYKKGEKRRKNAIRKLNHGKSLSSAVVVTSPPS
uniref:A-kinase anchor protein 17A-like n=1 Tax=Ciona intestinalis TaxID=7719 RepID=UPI00006A6043|nr:A-kinase anchor protein 17A-like [Ciona intestinalis]|eukprot:XP_026691848.1 A-kinase anchor protein 17A-like [Ciona intestinalis]